ncbi:MAG TPA: MFS transporter [Acidimicrobiales bacterium]|nr:MFS transporter [Acidimicrobiales bacterium]
MAGLGSSFRRLLTASALSNGADGVFQVALPILAVSLTRSPAQVAGVALAARLPWLFMALPAGALADRLDRRRTMVRVQLSRVVVMGALAGVVALDQAAMWMLYLAAVVLGIGETLFDTAAQSILPSLVGRDDLARANGRQQAVELVMNAFLGPPLGGLLAAVALALAFGVSAAAFLLAAIALMSVAGSFRPERTAAEATRTLRQDIIEGVAFVWGHPVLRTLGLMLGTTNLAFTAHGSIFVLYAIRPGPMGLTPTGFGLLLASASVGGVAGSLAADPIARSVGPTRCLRVAVVVFGSALAVPALTASVVANGVAFMAATFAGVVWNVITVSLRQRITPDRLLGRMNSAYRLLGWGTMPIGAALGGLVAETAGLRATFVVAAALHLPMLLGFIVVTDRRMRDAEEG